MSNNGKVPTTAKWTIMIYMAVDDAVGIPEANKFLEELYELNEIIKTLQLKPNETGSLDLRICLQTYTNWPAKNNKPGGFGSRRFEIDENFSLDNPLDIDGFDENLSMGSSDALSGFIKWCKSRCNADNYLLFLWGHGTGSSMFSLNESYEKISDLYPELTLTDLETGRQILSIDELTGKDSLFVKNNTNKIKIRVCLYNKDDNESAINMTLTRRTTDFYIGLGDVKEAVTLYDLLPEVGDREALSPEIQRLKRFLTTRSHLDALLEKEISKCLKKEEVDILLIMGCCMQMVEFGYELRNSKNKNKSFYYVASEELIYFDGYNYKDSFKTLAENPFMDPETLAIRIVLDTPAKKTYTEYQRHAMAISCVDLTKNQLLTDYLNSFAELVMNISDKTLKDEVLNIIKKARQHCRHFGEDAYTYSFIDTTWFFSNFNKFVKENPRNKKELIDLSNKIFTFLSEEYVIQSWIGIGRTPSFNYPRSYGGHGVGIYFPESITAHINNGVLNKFFTLGNAEANDFTKEKKWSKFIAEYRKNYGEVSSYAPTGTPAPVDKEKQMLQEDKNDLMNILTNALLENDRIKSEMVPDILLKIYSTGTN